MTLFRTTLLCNTLSSLCDCAGKTQPKLKKLLYEHFLNSFVPSGHFYSASSSPLLLRSAPDIAQILCRSFTPKHHRQRFRYLGALITNDGRCKTEIKTRRVIPCQINQKNSNCSPYPLGLSEFFLHKLHAKLGNAKVSASYLKI